MTLSAKSLALLAVALLVVTAGCGGGGSPSTTAAPTSQDGTGSTSAPTTQAPTTTYPSPDIPFPPGFSRAGIDQGVRVMKFHYENLTNVSYTVSRLQGTENATGTAQIEPSSDELLLNFVSRGVPIDLYTENGSGHRRLHRPGNVTVERTNVSIENARQIFAITVLTSTYSTASYAYRGTTTHDGTAVHRYEITGVRPNQVKRDSGNFSNLSGYMEVRPDGVVVDYRWEGEYLNTPRVFEYTLTDVGSTDVVRPDWVPEDGTDAPPNGTDAPPATNETTTTG